MSYMAREERPKLTVPVQKSKYDPLLVDLLSKCTPHKFEFHITNIIKAQPFIKPHTFEEVDDNVIITVGNSETLFSCHMDIVGQVWEENAKRGTVDSIILMSSLEAGTINSVSTGFLYGSKLLLDKDGKFSRYSPSTLGADDKVGVFILLKMIEAGIPGIYVFHVGEECGGVGSRKLTTDHKKRFEGLKRAIAFDRAGYGDIIDYQRGGTCCSSSFGKALAESLNPGMPPLQKFKAGVSGTFTDTANYRDIIPECTNVSVGYFNQHGPDEKLDYIWLKHVLLPQILKVDYEALPTERDPAKKTIYTSSSWGTGSKNSWFNSTDVGRKTWSTVLQDTPNSELPKWLPEYGIVDNVHPDIMLRCIQAYFVTTYEAKAKEDLGERYFELLDFNDMLLEENTVLKHQLRLTKHGKKAKVTAKLKEIKSPAQNENTTLVAKRITLLEKLVTAANNYSWAVGEDNANILLGYSKGGEHFLKENLTAVVLQPKAMKKLNRMIYMISYLLSLTEYDIDDSDPAFTSLLIECHAHITAHITEEGFDQGTVKPKVTTH